MRAWRRAQRERLLARRLAIGRAERSAAQAAIARSLHDAAAALPMDCVAYYWPFKGEVDLHPLLQSLVARGSVAALPVVLERGAPMVFRRWVTGEPLTRGIWDIPIPATDLRVRPTLLLVPLLAYDAAGYRLGYGGGYYDRTLAALQPKPLTIGIGYAAMRLATIHPQAHDVPMDRILTETGWVGIDDAASAGTESASSPCAMAGADPGYMGFMSEPELVTLLNDLLAAERAGARGVATMAKRAEIDDAHSLLQRVAHDEASCCAMLGRHLNRLQAQATQTTGAFYEQLLGMEDPLQQLAFLNRGQCWVVRRLRAALPRVRDAALAGDLRHMLDVHVRNIEACESLLAALR